MEANKSTAKLFLGKASGTKKRTALLRKLFSFYKNVVFPAQAVYSYLPANFRVKMFLYYSQIIASNFSILECIGNKLHWVNAGFFFFWLWWLLVLPSRERNNFTVKLKTYQCILFPNFHWNYILFQISALGLNMSYSEMSQI